MSKTVRKSKHANDNTLTEQPAVNISRVRRAVDFSPEFTSGERQVAGVIADHFNAEEGYAFPTYRYLEFVYGFSPDTIGKTVKKLKSGWMVIDRSGGNNQYVPNMQKVESVLAALDARRAEWKEEKIRQSRYVRRSKGATRDVAAVLRGTKPNVQRIAQPQRPTLNLDRSALGVAGASSGGSSAYGADRHGNEKPWPYKQTKAEADQIFERLERMPWKKAADDPEFQPTAKADQAARIHWHRLLKSEIAAWRIESAAERFMAECPENQRPCLAGFLGRYGRQCIEPEEWLYIPDDEPSSAAGDGGQEQISAQRQDDEPLGITAHEYWSRDYSMQDIEDAKELHNLDSREVDAKIDQFIDEHDAKGQRHARCDWSPIWREWIGLAPVEVQDRSDQLAA